MRGGGLNGRSPKHRLALAGWLALGWLPTGGTSMRKGPKGSNWRRWRCNIQQARSALGPPMPTWKDTSPAPDWRLAGVLWLRCGCCAATFLALQLTSPTTATLVCPSGLPPPPHPSSLTRLPARMFFLSLHHHITPFCKTPPERIPNGRIFDTLR